MTSPDSARAGCTPWQLSGCRSKIDGRGFKQYDAHWVEIDGKLTIAAVLYDPAHHTRDFRHAKRIAACQDMYEALKSARDLIAAQFGDDCMELADVDAAIAKAEGRTP